MGVYKSALGKRLVSCMMSAVLAAGLAPAPSLAEMADELQGATLVAQAETDGVVESEPETDDGPAMPAFEQCEVVGDVAVVVRADEGVFPAGGVPIDLSRP